MAKEEKQEVTIEADEERVFAPSGVQKMNEPMEPDPLIALQPGEDIERVLTDEVHVDMGRGALTFKPGDKVTIRDGSIVHVTTREGMEYDFTPAHEAARKERESAVAAELQSQNLAAGQVGTPVSPAPAPSTQLQPSGLGDYVDPSEAAEQPGRVIGEGGTAEEDVIPIPDDELPVNNPAPDVTTADEDGEVEAEADTTAETTTTATERPRTETGQFAPKE